MEQECYSLCALLVVTNSTKCLSALLEDGALHVNHRFGTGYGNVTLAHLACALGSGDIVQMLLNQNGSRSGIWVSKDDEGMKSSVYMRGWSGFVSMCGGGMGGWE